MRVALDTNTIFQGHGAARTYFRELLPELLGLAGEDDEIFVFHSDDSGSLQWLLREDQTHSVDPPFKGRASDELWRRLNLPGVERLAKGPDRRRVGQLDVCHSVAPPLMPSRADRRIVSVHGVGESLAPDLKRSLRRADIVVVPSLTLQTQLLHVASETRGLEGLEERLEIVRPGVNRRYVDPPKPSDVEVLCNAHPFLEQDYLLVQGGASKQDGGLEMVLDAYRIALQHAELPPLAILVSDPESSDFLVESLAQRGLEDQVLLLEDLDRETLPALYRGADFLLYPGAGSGFGTAVLEAAAAGVPSIIGPTCGVLEVIWQGLLVPPDADPQSWAEAMVRLRSSRDERAQRSEQVAAEARKADWESVARRHWEIYREVATR